MVEKTEAMENLLQSLFTFKCRKVIMHIVSMFKLLSVLQRDPKEQKKTTKPCFKWTLSEIYPRIFNLRKSVRTIYVRTI